MEEEGILPNLCYEASIIILIQKLEKNKTENYRSISLMNIFIKNKNNKSNSIIHEKDHVL